MHINCNLQRNFQFHDDQSLSASCFSSPFCLLFHFQTQKLEFTHTHTHTEKSMTELLLSVCAYKKIAHVFFLLLLSLWESPFGNVYMYLYYNYKFIIITDYSPSAGCWKLTQAQPNERRVTTSRQTRMDRTGPAVENLSNSPASLMSWCKSPTYKEAIFYDQVLLVLINIYFGCRSIITINGQMMCRAFTKLQQETSF